MSTANLQAEVQLRIDALAYPTPSTELLQNAVDTVGLGLDLTNITSVLNSSTAAIDANTPDDDVTALNATSIALGVTSKGDGSALPQLAQNLSAERQIVTPITDTTGAITEMINASGKFLLRSIQLSGSTAGDYYIQLIIDGEIIWDNTVTTASNNFTFDLRDSYLVKESIVFNLQASTDTSVGINAGLMPIK